MSFVKDVMVSRVVTVEPSDSVSLAARRMNDKFVGSLVVVEDGRPVGIITDRDIAIRVVALEKPHTTPVAEVMTHNPITINERASFFELTRLFRKSAVRRIIVVNDEGFLRGIVSIDDILEILSTEFANLLGAIRG